jgi:hypothetical protein
MSNTRIYSIYKHNNNKCLLIIIIIINFHYKQKIKETIKMTKFICKKEFFESSGTKAKFHLRFRDENNSLPKIILCYAFWYVTRVID